MKKYFEELSDSRQAGKIKYNLVEVVVMAIVTVTAGAKHWNEIAIYCKAIYKESNYYFSNENKSGIMVEKKDKVVENGKEQTGTNTRINGIQ